MQRRRFLQNSALLPVWLAAVARGQEAAPDAAVPGLRDRRTFALARAWDEARAFGRPLLVLVLPPSAATRSGEPGAYQGDELGLRGLAWAQVLRFGEDAVLAELSLCVVACATLAEARATLPEECGLKELESPSPLALLVESDLSGSKAVEVRLEPIAPGGVSEWMAAREGVETPFVRQVAARVAAIGAALHAVIAPDDATLARRAEQARRASSEPADPVPADASPEALRERIARVPAVVLAAARTPPGRPEWIAQMATRMRAESLETAPAGSRWGVHTGCGWQVQGLQIGMSPCGIAHVPEQDRRFLHFYARS